MTPSAPRLPPRQLDDDTLLSLAQQALESVHGSEALDISALDGFLCGVALQPRRIPATSWFPWVMDSEHGAAASAEASTSLRELAEERLARLDGAIAKRNWFDPWVFELEGPHDPSEVVASWVAGFGLAVDVFPDLMALDESRLTEPLALLYRHLDPEDLDEADALLEQIEELEPPSDVGEAVEELVRATLLLADVSRPVPAPASPMRPRRPGPRGGGRPRGGPRR